MNDYNPSTITFSNNFCKDLEIRERMTTTSGAYHGLQIKKKLRKVQYKRCEKETKEVINPEIIKKPRKIRIQNKNNRNNRIKFQQVD